MTKDGSTLDKDLIRELAGLLEERPHPARVEEPICRVLTVTPPASGPEHQRQSVRQRHGFRHPDLSWIG